MNKTRYTYQSEASFEFFEFYSEGHKGKIRKLVEYQRTKQDHVYNLAFGDYDETIKGINDLAVTNNGDSLKVLATVAATVYDFLTTHPGAWIIAAGSTMSRTRLYRIGIANNLEDISRDFFIFGFNQEDKWEPFITGENYSAFLITKK